MFKGQKGITLVALVITIIVLLILAGVSISLVVGQNGVLGKATNSVAKTKAAGAKEAVQLAIAACEAEYYSKWSSDQSEERSTYYTGTAIAAQMGGGYSIENPTTGSIISDTTETTLSVKSGTDTIAVNLKANTAGTITWGTITVGSDVFNGATMEKNP